MKESKDSRICDMHGRSQMLVKFLSTKREEIKKIWCEDGSGSPLLEGVFLWQAVNTVRKFRMPYRQQIF
jgi:hypothetical protein